MRPDVGEFLLASSPHLAVGEAVVVEAFQGGPLLGDMALTVAWGARRPLEGERPTHRTVRGRGGRVWLEKLPPPIHGRRPEEN